MAISEEDFRTVFAEFADETKYPTGRFDYWAAIAALSLNIDRWGNFLTHGTYLYIAHHLVLSARAATEAAAGRAPGQSSGVITSKSVGDVTVSLDTNAVNEDSAGNYNLTEYGREFIRLARIVGMGGAYIT
jgi:hypothetical protein